MLDEAKISNAIKALLEHEAKQNRKALLIEEDAIKISCQVSIVISDF